MALPFKQTSDPAIAAHSHSPEEILRGEREDKYPLQVWYFLASFIFLVSIINWVDLAIGYFRARRQKGRPAQRPALPQGPNTRGSIDLLRLPLALTDTFRALSFRWAIPIGRSYSLNIMQVFLSATYIIILYTWALIFCKVPDDWANRTGRIAAIQVPLIVALGMKNNIISFLTGVSFEKLNYLHRMAARVAMVMIWVHAATRISLGLTGDKVITIPGIRAGVVSAATLTFLCLVSIRPIRNRAYEVFLIVHLSLAATFILCLYFHNARRGLGHYIWPAILLWGLDRVIRMCHLLISFFSPSKVETSSGPKISSSPKIELLPGRLMRLTTPAPKFFHWRPGQSAYLTLPKISSTPLEGHPFTISSIDSKSSPPELKFLIQNQKGRGFTGRLYDLDGSSTVGNVLVDGPYSSPPRLIGYDAVLLIAGGSGVSFALPLLLDLIERSKLKEVPCRRLTFAWAIRHIEHISWIQEDLLDALQDIPSNLTVDIHIFVSNKTPNSTQTDINEDPEKLDDDAGSSSQKAEHEFDGDADVYEKCRISGRLLSLPMIKIHRERADLTTFINNEVAQAQDCMSVNVCGSVRLSRAVRQATRNPRMVDILRGGPTISLHVESFDNA